MTRIERLAALLEEPLLVAGPPYVLGGQANVRYLTGLASSNAAVLVEPDATATVFTDFRYASRAREIAGAELVETARLLLPAIGAHLAGPALLVDKSTVPVGTADKVRAEIARALQARGSDVNFAVVSNPEFLKEGAALEDFMKPDRIIVGSDDEQATLMMRALYAPFTRSHDRLMVMDVKSAEFTKYAANAMLATRISFMNELALLAEKVGADIELVRRGIGSDPRIGYQFLYAGAGYGGSCFPKDVKALVRTGREHGQDLKVLNAVEEANDRQKLVLVDKVVARFGEDLTGRRFALWGLAFKPNTDDMREAPSLVVVQELARRGAAVAAYDPVAMGEAAKLLSQVPGVSFCERAEHALSGSDALIVITEWKEFRTPDFDRIRSDLKQPVVFDGRNLYEPATMAMLGLEHHAIGRGTAPRPTA